MSVFQLLIIIIGFVFLLFAIDLYERKKFNALHFLVFFSGTGLVILFTLRADLLDKFGRFFGVARGADVLVYITIIFLTYLYFESLNKATKQKMQVTKLVGNLAIQSAKVDSLFMNKETKKDDYCFLIRAYNEASVIEEVINEIIQAGFKRIVICNDGSSDGTETVLKGLQEKYGSIVTLQHTINRGPGAANQTLFARAKKYAHQYAIERFVTYDADGQMDIADMNKFIQIAETSKYDILLGSRFTKGGIAQNISTARRIILRGAKFVTWFFNKIYVTDPTNGYKLINAYAMQNISLESDGFDYASELLEKIYTHKFRRTEIPVHIKYTEYSIHKGQKSSNAMKVLKNLAYKAFFYK